MIKYETINRKEAEDVVKSLKEAKIGRAIKSEGRNVEIYRMERDAILKHDLPTHCWIVRCRDVMSARRFVEKLRAIAYSF